MASADLQNRPQSILFGPNSTSRFSHVFTVSDSSWIVQAYGLPEGQCICLEMVTGCHEGTEFEPVKAQCGCCICLSNGRTVIPIPMEGRYRLVACSDANLGDFRVVAHPTTIPQEYWSSFMSCCTTATAPTTLASPSGTLLIGGTAPNLTADVAPVPTAAALAASPAALAVLCPALKATCGFIELSDVPAPVPDTVTTIVATPTGFTYTNEAGVAVSVVIPAPVPDVVTTVVAGPTGFTYTNEAGVTVTVPFPAIVPDVVTTVVATPTGFTYTNEQGAAVTVTFPAAVPDVVTTLVATPTGFTYTNEAGVATPITFPAAVADVVTVINSTPGGFIYTNEAGVNQTISLGGTAWLLV